MKKPKRLVQFEVHWIDGKVDIIEGKSVMDAFERAGILIETACRSGECGLYRTKVLSGDVFVCPEGDGRRVADIVLKSATY